MTCVFDPERQIVLLKDSFHSCQSAPCDLSPSVSPVKVSHDCPSTVFEESCPANCLYGVAAISGSSASTVLDVRFRRILGERPNGSVSHLRSTDVLHRGLPAQRLFVWPGLRFLDHG